MSAADVLVKDSVATRAQQSEPCGAKGTRIELNFDTATVSATDEEKKMFVAELIKYRFGVFEEHGHRDIEVYPEFYWKLDTVSPNSCTNVAVAGNFNETCFNNPDSCEIEGGQNEIETSLLYNPSATLFPQVGLCNRFNMNIIKMK